MPTVLAVGFPELGDPPPLDVIAVLMGTNLVEVFASLDADGSDSVNADELKKALIQKHNLLEPEVATPSLNCLLAAYLVEYLTEPSLADRGCL